MQAAALESVGLYTFQASQLEAVSRTLSSHLRA